MRIIDFHTHFFPDEIAKQTMETLENRIGIRAHGSGKYESLLSNMEKEGIDISLNMPVATKPEQVRPINRKMIEYNKNKGRVINFGSMHPLFNREGDAESEISFLAKNGIKGIKMHPEYQQFFPDDGKMKSIYGACVKYGLIILFHAGADAAYDFESTHGTPGRMAEVAGAFKGMKIVLAHLGGFRMWDGVYKYLAGKDVYFDTAVLGEAEDGAVEGIINDHGAEKIVFGSDFPWGSPGDTRKQIERAVKDEGAREKIFYKNAESLLGL